MECRSEAWTEVRAGEVALDGVRHGLDHEVSCVRHRAWHRAHPQGSLVAMLEVMGVDLVPHAMFQGGMGLSW